MKRTGKVRIIGGVSADKKSQFSRPQFFRVLRPVTVTAECDLDSLVIGQLQPGVVVEVFCSQARPSFLRHSSNAFIFTSQNIYASSRVDALRGRPGRP